MVWISSPSSPQTNNIFYFQPTAYPNGVVMHFERRNRRYSHNVDHPQEGKFSVNFVSFTHMPTTNCCLLSFLYAIVSIVTFFNILYILGENVRGLREKKSFKMGLCRKNVGNTCYKIYNRQQTYLSIYIALLRKNWLENTALIL